MQVGNYVVFVLEPELYGVGRVEQVLGPGEDGEDSRLVVEFDGKTDLFSAHELELASVWASRRQAMGEAIASHYLYESYCVI
jgi:hypothetical protein